MDNNEFPAHVKKTVIKSGKEVVIDSSAKLGKKVAEKIGIEGGIPVHEVTYKQPEEQPDSDDEYYLKQDDPQGGSDKPQQAVDELVESLSKPSEPEDENEFKLYTVHELTAMGTTDEIWDIIKARDIKIKKVEGERLTNKKLRSFILVDQQKREQPLAEENDKQPQPEEVPEQEEEVPEVPFTEQEQENIDKSGNIYAIEVPELPEEGRTFKMFSPLWSAVIKTGITPEVFQANMKALNYDDYGSIEVFLEKAEAEEINAVLNVK